jgi:hypothetical protein
MTEEEFLQLTPWLTADRAAPEIERAREDLARFYGVGWYVAPNTVAEFFRYLNTGERTVALLAELPSVGGAPDRQGTWLGSVVAEIEAAVRESQQAPAQAEYTEPEFDSAYQLYYRYDHRAGAYQWSADPASGQWMDQAHADEYARAAMAHAQQPAQSQQPAPQEQPRYSAAEWDANAGLYYRYDYVDGIYEWSADGNTGWAGAQQPAAQEPVPEQAPAPVSEQAPPPAPAPPEDVIVEVAARRAEALEATIAEIRDAGVSLDDMSDEEIQAMFDQTVLESS